MLCTEGAEEVDLYQSYLFPLVLEHLHGLFHGVRTTSHHHDNAFSIGCTDVVEKVVLASGQFGKRIHSLLDNIGGRFVELVDRFPGCKEDIGVLAGSPNDRLFRVHSSGSMGANIFIVDHFTHHIIGNLFHLLDFMAGPESIKEVDKRNSCLKGRRLGDEGVIHGLLNVVAGEHGKAGGAGSHHIGMITENGERLGCNSSCCNVKHCGCQLSGNLEHVGDHQQQSLARGKGCCKRAGGKSAVHRTGSSRFRLKLNYVGDRSPNVFSALGAVHISQLSHGRRRSNRINCNYLVCGMGHMGDGRIAVDRNHLFLRHFRVLYLGVLLALSIPYIK